MRERANLLEVRLSLRAVRKRSVLQLEFLAHDPDHLLKGARPLVTTARILAKN
jgi:hypothetical protein